MKCPFKKETYIKNRAIFEGVAQDQFITEEFADCIKNECAIYNKSSGCCGFLKAITIPIPETGS